MLSCIIFTCSSLKRSSNVPPVSLKYNTHGLTLPERISYTALLGDTLTKYINWKLKNNK